MKLFRELKIEGSADKLVKVIEAIANNLDEGWHRDEEAEAEINSVPRYGSKLYCFSCSESEKRRASNLWLSDASLYGRLFVSNILPNKFEKLSYDEYNYILEEFCDRFVVPATKNIEVEIKLTDAEIDLKQLIEPETVEVLHRFSEDSNRLGGNYLPLSKKDWYIFLVEVHKNQVQLNTAILERWLKEEEGWPEDIVSNLVEEYEFAKSLLDCYEQHR